VQPRPAPARHAGSSPAADERAVAPALNTSPRPKRPNSPARQPARTCWPRRQHGGREPQRLHDRRHRPGHFRKLRPPAIPNSALNPRGGVSSTRSKKAHPGRAAPDQTHAHQENHPQPLAHALNLVHAVLLRRSAQHHASTINHCLSIIIFWTTRILRQQRKHDPSQGALAGTGADCVRARPGPQPLHGDDRP
jgi:hypothetical protein